MLLLKELCWKKEDEKKILIEKKGSNRGENGDIKGVKEEKCNIIYWEWKKKKWKEIKVDKDFFFFLFLYSQMNMEKWEQKDLESQFWMILYEFQLIFLKL